MWVRSFTGISRLTHTIMRNQSPRCYMVRMSTTATNGKPVESEVGDKEPVVDTQKATEVKASETLAAEKQLKEEKEKFEMEIKKLKDKYMRSLAETENVRQRMKKQVDDAKLFGIQGFCKDLLEVADVLGKATESVPKEEITQSNPHLKNLYEGLVLTESQLQKVFIKHGLQQIVPTEGDKFDPFFHEALFEVPTQDREGGTIAMIQKIGYKLQERTVRPALVGVFKAT